MKGLDRLRIALGMGLLSTAVLATTRSARAGTGGTVVAGNGEWIYSNATYGNAVAPFGSCGGGKRGLDYQGRALKAEKLAELPNGSAPDGCGLGVTEASLNQGAFTDAFDGALVMAVNGTVFKNPDATLDLTGTTVTSDLRNIGGLNTQVQFFFEPSNTAVRVVYSFSNTTGAALPANVLIDSNLGSDGNTLVAGTSDGDTVIEPSDTWFVTNDDGGADRGGTDIDPPLTWVRYGAGAAVTPNALALFQPGAIRESFTLNVPAGATQRLMLIVKLNTGTPGALAAGAALDSLPELQSAGLLAGMSAQQQSELVNWAAGAGQVITEVPSLSDWSRIGLLLSLAVGGMAAVRLGTRRGIRA